MHDFISLIRNLKDLYRYWVFNPRKVILHPVSDLAQNWPLDFNDVQFIF